MTQPDFTTGYPDWRRLQQRATPLLINHPLAGVASGTIFGPFYVGIYDAVILTAQIGSGGAQLQLEWSDQATGVTVLQQNVNILFGGTVRICKPVVADRLRVTYITDTGVNRTLALFLNGAYGNGLLASGAFTEQLIEVSDQNILAGANATVDATEITEGPACFQWATQAAAFTITLQARDYQAAIERLAIAASGRGAAATGSVNLYVPAKLLRVSMTNNDAATKGFDVHVTSLRG